MHEIDIGALVLVPAPGLRFTRQGRGERVRYVASDPHRGRHAALSPDAYRLLGQLDGQRTLQDIYAGAGETFPSPDAASHLVARLKAAGLIDAVGGALPPAPMRPSGPLEAKLVSWRRELVDLGPWLPQVDRWLGWMFTRTGAVAWSVLAVLALWLVVDRWEPSADLLGWLSQLGAGEALSLYVIFLLLKGFHELGHAVAYRRLAAAEGVSVHSVRAGIALMFLLPFPFTNVTGAWRLASRWRRAMIGAAGMYVESWAALVSILVWALADDPMLRSAAGQVALVAGLTTLLFNLNPLGRMDGYYIAADLVDRPNLGRQAAQAAMAAFARLIGALPGDRSQPLEPSLIAYWFGSLLFRAGIYVTLFWAALRNGAFLAVVVLLIAGSLLVVRPLVMTLRWLLSITPDATQLRQRLIGLGIAVGAVLMTPISSAVHIDGIVEKQNLSLIFAPRAAPLSADGQLAFSSREARLEHAEIEAQRLQALTEWRHALDDGQGFARSHGDEVRALTAQAASLQRDIKRLETGLSGSDVTPLDAADRRGSWVPVSDQPLAVRMPSERYIVRGIVRERDRTRLRAGLTGEARPLGRPDQRFDIRIAGVDAEAMQSLPSAALGRPFGGSIAVDPADKRARRPIEPVIGVTAAALASAPPLRHGQRIELRIDGPRRPLIVQWIDRLLSSLGAPTVG